MRTCECELDAKEALSFQLPASSFQLPADS
jgi:hypothetical protein